MGFACRVRQKQTFETNARMFAVQATGGSGWGSILLNGVRPGTGTGSGHKIISPAYIAI